MKNKRSKEEKILYAVCSHFGITPDTLRKRSRKREIVLPRSILCYMLKNTTDLSYSQIGIFIGGFDHTTVMHSVKTAENDIATNIGIMLIYNEIIGSLKD